MPLPPNLDHLVYFADDLERGMEEIEAKLGVAPVKGGSHPGFGTCNALISLGDTAYLEVLAPDPQQPGPGQEAWLKTIPKGRSLATWVMRSADIDASAAAARGAGGAIGKTLDGKRQAPGGALLEWRLSDPLAMPFDGCVPFLIDWGNSPHPAANTPQAGIITHFAIEHPDASALSRVFAAMGEDVDVRDGPAPVIRAIVEGAKGNVRLD